MPEVVPISNHPVSHDPSLDDVQYVKTILKNEKAQQEAKGLEPEDALKYVELLDQVRFSLSLPGRWRLTGNRF